jgi:protein gp37
MGPRCKNCPACAGLKHLGLPLNIAWPSLVSEWEKVHELRAHGLILLCSDSDTFIEEAELHWDRIVAGLQSRPDCTFVALTRRLGNARRFVDRFGVLPNLWLGTSAEDQTALDETAPTLYSIPAAGYVLSLQPLLGPVFPGPYLTNPKLHLVVTGCELGDRARRCPRLWLDQVELQCHQHRVDCFITRWMDAKGKVHTANTRNGRGSNRKDYPGFNPLHRCAPTVRSMIEKH